MGPETFFTEQLAMLDAFFSDPSRTCHVVRIDPEMRRMPYNYLARRDEDPTFPHLIFAHQEPFTSAEAWFARLTSMLHAQIADARENLAAAGVNVEVPPQRQERANKPWESWIDWPGQIADSLPAHAGALVFLIEPGEVADASVWNKALCFLADFTRSDRVKYLIIEPRLTPLLDDACEHPRIGSQLFWMSPAEIEQRANDVLLATQTARLQ
ncbi:MAG: hypothetical protein ACFB03_10930 [Paracoccaceae bacterium]